MTSSATRKLPIVAVGVPVAALALAGWAALRPTESPDSVAVDESSSTGTAFTDAERDVAATKGCGAFDTARKGVSTNTNASVPGGNADIAGSLAIAGVPTSDAAQAENMKAAEALSITVSTACSQL